MAKERFELSDGVKDLLSGMGKLSAEMKDNSAKAMEYAQSMDKLAKQNTELTKLNEALSTSFSKVSNALNKASSGNDLTKYIKSQENMVKSINRTYRQYSIQSDTIKKNQLAEELYKQVNALRAVTDSVDLSNLVGNFEEVKKAISSVGSYVKSEFSVSAFKEINETIEVLEQAGLKIKNVFSTLDKGSKFYDIDRELRETKEQLDLINNTDISELTGKLKKLGEIAEEEFNTFLNLYNISGRSYKFYDIFEEIRSGAITSQQAIERVKNEFEYLLVEAKSSGNQNYDVLNSSAIREMVENISTLRIKVDEIMTRVSNVHGDTTGIKIFDEEQFSRLLILFEKIESSLSSMKAVFVDVGDGEEFSPLLKMIDNVQSSIKELSISVNGIGLNMNIDVGSDKELETQFQDKISKALIAYQRLFDHIKMSGVGGSVINDAFFNFDLNQFDTTIGKVKGLQQFIAKAREDAKALYGGQDVLKQDTDVKFWNQASAALAQMSIVEKQIRDSTDTSSLESLFGGKTDLTEVTAQLGLIVTKLEEISANALEFKNIFKEGFNVTTSIEEIEKLTSRVKELEDELSKVKVSSTSPIETNISSGNEVSTVQDKITTQVVENEKRKQDAYKATADAVIYHAGVISKLNKAESNGQFYGSSRNTGFFGTGHYFVDSATKHELTSNKRLAEMPFTSVDISKYENLFKANTDEIAGRLHDFLANLTRYTQGSDSFNIGQLFSQFESVFGEAVMDIKDFESKLEQLKSYMQNSSINDRGDSVSTQFMKSLGYEGVDTRGTKYADTRYGTVIYDLKEESVLQANITDELQKQGQMLEKINYEKGQVFDSTEDAKIQAILDKQTYDKLVSEEYDKLYDSSKLNDAYDKLEQAQSKLQELQRTISACESELEDADDFGFLDEEEIESTKKQLANATEESKLLQSQITEIEKEIENEIKLSSEAYNQAKQIVDLRSQAPIKDTFQGDTEASEMGKVATAVDEAVQAKKDFATANEGVQDSVDGSKSKLELETELMERLAKSAREAADAKKEFVEANKQVQGSVDDTGKSVKKDKYKNKSKISEDEYTGKSDYYASIANQKLKNSGNTILGETVSTELVDGLVKVTAKIKTADDTWKTFSAKIDADGNMFEQRFRTITKGVDKLETELKNFGLETNPALSYGETLKKAEEIRSSLKLDDSYTIKVDSNELVTITQKLSDVKSSTTSVTQTFKSAQDAIEHFGKEASSSAEKTTVALKGVKASAESIGEAVGESFNFESIDKSLDKYNDKLRNFTVKPANGHRYPIYQKNIDDLTEKVSKLQTLRDNLSKKDINLISKEDIDEVNTLEKDIDELIFKMSKMSASEKGFDPLGADKALEKINSELKKNSAMSKEAKRQIQGFYDEIRSGNPSKPIKDLLDDMYKLIQAERLAGREGKSFMDIFKEKVVYGAAANMAGMIGIYDVINVFRQGFETIKEYDNALTEMNKVSKESIGILKEFQKESFDLADAVGTTASQIQNSTADFLRLGESFEQAKQSAQDANALFKVAEFDNISEATDALVAMSQAYKELDKSQINDVLNYTGNNFSISTSELASALQRSAATLKVAGNDIYEATALVTAGNAVLQDAETVGSGLKMISLRILGTEEAKNELASLGENVDDFVVQTKSKIDETVRNYTAVASNGFKGISVLDENGNYRSTYEILRDISLVYQEILEADKKAGTNRGQALLEVLAGKNRSNVAASILQSPELLTSVYEEAMKNSQGSVEKELEAQLQSIETHLNQLKNAWDELWINEHNREVINFFLDLAKGILEVVDNVGVLNTAIMGIGAFAGIKNVGIGMLVAY